jgi:phage-related protein
MRLDFVIVLARVQDIEIGNTVNPKVDSFAIDQLIRNTEDNEKGFANVSEVTGNSRIKMEGVCKTR